MDAVGIHAFDAAGFACVDHLGNAGMEEPGEILFAIMADEVEQIFFHQVSGIEAGTDD